MADFGVDRRWRAALLGGAVFLGIMALVAAIFLIGRNERAFELHRWEVRLHAASTERLDVVNRWLNESRNAMRSVAVNPTVQIYLTELAAANGAVQSVPNADTQAAFVASYVMSMGGQGPFATSAGGGLAVFDPRFRLVAATSGYKPSQQIVKALIAARKNGQDVPQVLSGGAIAFLSVIAPIQGNAGAVGYAVGQRRMDSGFWSSGGASLTADHGHESLIAVDPYGVTRLVGSSLAAKGDAAASAEALAAREPGRLQQGRDLDGRESLSLGVPVAGTNWALVESVPRSVALAGVDARIRNLTVILLLSLLAIILAVLALWRHNAAAQQIAMREASVKLYRGIADTLLAAIDQRDPGAADHSRRVARLARDMAVRMGLSAAEADTVELAGALMNVGKLFVPPELLTKQGALDEVESARFAEGSRRWLELLGRAPLDPPVEPILREAYALGAGGPAKSENVSRGTYIVVAANVAIALTSPRAYRAAYAPGETLEILSRSGISFPRPVMAALSDLLLACA